MKEFFHQFLGLNAQLFLKESELVNFIIIIKLFLIMIFMKIMIRFLHLFMEDFNYNLRSNFYTLIRFIFIILCMMIHKYPYYIN